MSDNSATRTKIGAICEITSSKRIYRADYVDEGVPFYRGKEVIERHRGNLDVTTELFISEEKYNQIEEKFGAPGTGDLLLTSVGTIGVPYVVQPNERFYFKDGNLTWFRHFDGLNSHFLYYWLLSPAGKEQWRSGIIGVAQPALTIVRLKEMEIDLPDLPTQKKIAGILSAYDDLIENNLRRIAILEEMAQSLYREWFVHFRFPGHETVQLVDSELGKIPEGWEVKKLGEFSELTMGLSPKGNTYNNEGVGMPLVNGPVEFSDRFTKAIKWTSAPNKVSKEGDLIVCVRGSTTGKHVKSDGVYCLGRGVCSLANEHQSFLDYLFKHQLPNLLAMTNGSTFPSWTGPLLKNHPVLVPSKSLIEGFDKLGSQLNSQIQTLDRKNQNLRKTRDLLLPKLLGS